jgi:Tn3 transposase DDE domain
MRMQLLRKEADRERLTMKPRSEKELLMVYAGILAHGTSMSAAETARMMPQLSATSVRQAMRWASDERRLTEACTAVLSYMHRHPIAASWGVVTLNVPQLSRMIRSKGNTSETKLWFRRSINFDTIN